MRNAGDIKRRISADIADLDRNIARQLDAILHHSRFQRLEAAWRGLEWLVESVPPEARVKIRVLDVSWKELARDADRAIEFDQSQLFKKIYSAEFGIAGGEPFGGTSARPPLSNLLPAVSSAIRPLS